MKKIIIVFLFLGCNSEKKETKNKDSDSLILEDLSKIELIRKSEMDVYLTASSIEEYKESIKRHPKNEAVKYVFGEMIKKGESELPSMVLRLDSLKRKINNQTNSQK